MPFPIPGDLPNPGIELASLSFPALTGRFFTSSATWEALLSTILLHGYTTVYLPIDKYFGCFQFGAIVNSFYKHSCTSCFVNLSLHIVFPVFFGWTASFFFFAVRQLSLVVWNRGHPSLQSTGFSWQGRFLLQSTGSRGTGFNSCSIRAHSLGLMYPRAWAQKLWHTRLSFSEACEIFPDQNLNPCPLQ